MSEDWRNLQKGDRIRFFSMPADYSRPGYKIDPSTLALYSLLISTGDSMEIVDFLPDGSPIASYVDRRVPDSPEFHGLVIDDVDDGCWERVTNST